MSEPYKPAASWFAAQGQDFYGKPYSVMDCQGLVENMLQNIGIFKNWRGSNAMWRDMAWTGTPEEAQAIFGGTPTGAFLFILKNDGGEVARGYKDGLGNAQHVGVCTNTGKGAVHSSSSKGKVCESVYKGKTIPNGGWNRVGLCKLLDYGPDVMEKIGGTSVSEPKPTGYPAWVVLEGKTGTVNMREGAGTKHRILAKLRPGTEVLVVETGETWHKIVFDGQTGYMMTKYLTPDHDRAVQTAAQAKTHYEVELCDGVSLLVDRAHAEKIFTWLQGKINEA